MLLVGLTGGIATGKSTVAAMFRDLGGVLIDADDIAREVVLPGTPGLEALCRQFGRGILDGAGCLNRAALGNIVFRNPDLLKSLNRLLHPLILDRMEARIREEREAGAGILILDVPLLFETGLHARMDAVVVVLTGEEDQVRRLMARDRLGPEEVRQRLAAQMPLAEKAGQADFIIDNGGSREETERQVREVWQALQERGGK
jgi:dephospho-CoA kinase